MGTFLVYIIKSAFCLTLLYLPYTLLLRKEKLHRLNRMALFAILVASFLLPLAQEEWFGQGWHSWQTAVPDGVYASLIGQLDSTGHFLPAVVVTAGSPVPVWPMVLVGMYWVGVAVSLAVRLWQFGRMRWFIPRGCLWKECREDGITLYCHARPVAPFSWMCCVVMSEEDLEGAAGEAIFAHEKAHVLHRHSYDTMLMLAAEAIQWFNPVIWMMEMDMRCIHEYQADEYVLNQGINAKNYQLYLIKKAVGSRLQSFANGLNQSTLKKRIAMMCNRKSNKWAALKYMYLLPVGTFATMAFARPEMANRVDGQFEQISAVKVTDLSATVKTVAAENVQPELLKTEKVAENTEKVKGKMSFTVLPGRKDSLYDALDGTVGKVTVTAPALKSDSARMKITGTTVVEGEGTVVRSGKPESRATYFYVKKKAYKAKGQKVYEKVDVNPQFAGGEAECMKFVAYNIRYPKKCVENGVTGKVVCRFVVSIDGSISNVEASAMEGGVTEAGLPASKEMFDLLAQEAVRVIEKMPKWIPGQKDGKAVATRFSLPVTFRLQ